MVDRRLILFAAAGSGSLSLILHGWMVFIHWRAVSPGGDWSVAGVELFFLPCLGALLLIGVGVLLSSFETMRRFAVPLVVASVVHISSYVAADSIARGIRHDGFERLGETMAPVVRAIDAYASRERQPPSELSALVPDYLPELPRDMPSFDYYTGEESQELFHGNPWVLSLSTPTGIINWDQFLYYPRQNYPRAAHGGGLERIGDWAYVHE